MTEPLVLPLDEARDTAVVGGKAVNLARLIDGGLPVPPGFVLTTHAYRQSQEGDQLSPEVTEALTKAYQELGEPPVAVRSSATAEDRPDASMAGQYETFLSVTGTEELLSAVRRCWASLNSARTQA